MYCLLYDISDNKRRGKIVNLCKDYGLQRIQRSCFMGGLDGHQLKRIKKEIPLLLEPEEDKVCIIPVSAGMLKEATVWGMSFAQMLEKDENVYFI